MQCPFQCGSLEVQEVKTDWKSANESLKGRVDSEDRGGGGGGSSRRCYIHMYLQKLTCFFLVFLFLISKYLVLLMKNYKDDLTLKKIILTAC